MNDSPGGGQVPFELRGATRRQMLKYGAGGAVMLGLGGLGAFRARGDVRDASLFRDHVSPCFNNSPVGPPFTQPLPIPPILRPSQQTATADVYEMVEREGVTQIVPGGNTPI